VAGDWIKMEIATPEKGETLAITAAMGWDDPDLAVGKLFRVWRWFDQHTIDGNAPGVTPALLDRFVAAPGFAEAMRSVGWLTINSDGLTLPNFDRHNGTTAKSRALTAKRVKKFKQGNADIVTRALPAALPKEEKRREEKKNQKKESSSPSAPIKSSKDLVEGFVPSDDNRGWAAKKTPSVPVDAETDAWRDRMRQNGYRTNAGPVKDPAAAWRTAMRNAEAWGTYRKTPQRGDPPALPTTVLWTKD
jgi:hypothetical protein